MLAVEEFGKAGHRVADGYILVGIFLEERDLVERFGDQYRNYREQVGMLVPLVGRKARG